MKAWISVSAAEDERVGRRRAILRRWKKNVFMTLFKCDLKESVGSMMMPRFLTRGEGSDRVTICKVRSSGRWG